MAGSWSEISIGHLIPQPRQSFNFVPYFDCSFPPPSTALHVIEDLLQDTKKSGMGASSSVPALHVGFSRLSGLARLTTDKATSAQEPSLFPQSSEQKALSQSVKSVVFRDAERRPGHEYVTLNQPLDIWMFGGQNTQICNVQIWKLTMETHYSTFNVDLAPSMTPMTSLADMMHTAELDERTTEGGWGGGHGSGRHLSARSASSGLETTNSTLMLSQHGARKEIIRVSRFM